MGVRSMKLDEGEIIVDMAVIRTGKEEVLTVTEKGFGKRSSLEEYRVQGRAGKGIKAGNFSETTGGLAGLKLVTGDEDLIIIADSGIMIRTPVKDISVIGRATKGVIVMRLRDGGKVAAVAIAPHEEVEEAEIEAENVGSATETEETVTETAITEAEATGTESAAEPEDNE